MIAAGWLRVRGQIIDDPFAAPDLEAPGDLFEWRGQAWPWWPQALIALYKPAGYECSQKPKHHASVYSLLPQALRQRGVQCVGRLDEDTTGLLLLTDNGPWIHQLTSPKKHIHKVYHVGCRHPLSEAQILSLCQGVVLEDAPEPVKAVAAQDMGLWDAPDQSPLPLPPASAAATAVASGLHGLSLTLDEGRYHQVKRMVAAMGNRVERLHRASIGRYELPADMKPGQWVWLSGVDDVLPA